MTSVHVEEPSESLMEWGPPGIFVELVNQRQVENLFSALQWREGRIPI